MWGVPGVIFTTGFVVCHCFSSLEESVLGLGLWTGPRSLWKHLKLATPRHMLLEETSQSVSGIKSGEGTWVSQCQIPICCPYIHLLRRSLIVFLFASIIGSDNWIQFCLLFSKFLITTTQETDITSLLKELPSLGSFGKSQNKTQESWLPFPFLTQVLIPYSSLKKKKNQS